MAKVSPQFEQLSLFDEPKTEPDIKFFTAEKYPHLPDDLRLSMEKAKNAMDERQSREESEKGMLPGTLSAGGVDSRVHCGDCSVPMVDRPILRRNKPPRIRRQCPNCGVYRIFE